MDKDKKIVNTEEENRAVNTSGNTENPEDSISQDAAHTVNTDTTTPASSEPTRTTADDKAES